MNVLVCVLLLSIESLAQQRGGGEEISLENSDETSTQRIRILRHYPTTPDPQDELSAFTTEDPGIVTKRRACEHCLYEHRECTTLLDCQVCHVPCQDFEEDALPTIRPPFQLPETECHICLRNNPHCINNLKCEACRTICGAEKGIRAASRCILCKDSPRCKKYGKCDLCKKYCKRDEEKVPTTTVEPVKPLEASPEAKNRSSHILNLISSRRKAGIARLIHRNKPKVLHEVERDIHESNENVVGAAAPAEELCNPIMVSPVVAAAKDMNGVDLSQAVPRYYTVGAFKPGPRMNHVLHLLNVYKTDDIEKLIVIAKLKTPQVSGQEAPVLIDYSKFFSNVDAQNAPGSKVEGPSVELTSEIDKELQMAGEQKKISKGDSSLTPEEVFKVIQHAISLHKMREDGETSAPTQEETTTPIISVTDRNVVAQTPPVPDRSPLREKLVASKPLRTSSMQGGQEEKRTVSEEINVNEKSELDNNIPKEQVEEEVEVDNNISRQPVIDLNEEAAPRSKTDESMIVSQDHEEEPIMGSRSKDMESSSLVQETSSITPLEIKMQRVLGEEATSATAFAIATTSSVIESESTDEKTRSTEIEEEPIMGSRVKAIDSETPSFESLTENPAERSHDSEERQTQTEVMEKIREILNERKKKLEGATAAEKQRIDDALIELKQMLHKVQQPEEKTEVVVGMQQETTTPLVEITTTAMDEQDKKDLVEKFTGVIEEDLTGDESLTPAKKQEIEEEISKLVKSTVDGASKQRANEDVDNLDRDLTKIERLVESADDVKPEPSKGSAAEKSHLEKVAMETTPRKNEERVGEPFVVEAEEFTASGSTITPPTAMKSKMTEKPPETVTQIDFAKALVEDVTDVPEYVMKKMQKLIGKIPTTHRFKMPAERIAETEAILGQSQESSSSSSSEAPEIRTEKKQTELDWSLYTTSTSSPTAPWEFPKYEGATLNVWNGRESDNQVGRNRPDWMAKEETKDSSEFNTFGKIVPAKDTSSVVHHNFPSDLKVVKDAYFFGDMELPLRMKYYSDGTIKLAVDKTKYCQCNDKHCSAQDGGAQEANTQVEVMQLDEGDAWRRKNEEDVEFADVPLGMSAPNLLNRNADPEMDRQAQVIDGSLSENRSVEETPTQKPMDNVNENTMKPLFEEPTTTSQQMNRNEGITEQTSRFSSDNIKASIEPINENVERKENLQAKRESGYLKKLKERKNRLLAKLERKKTVFKRSPLLLDLLGSGEETCKGGDCEKKHETTRLKRHLEHKDVVQQKVGLMTNLLSWVKNVAANKKN